MPIGERLIRFLYHEGYAVPLIYLFGVGLSLWYARGQMTFTILLVTCAILFVGSYGMRHAILQRYSTVRSWLNKGTLVVLVCVIALRFLGQMEAGVVLFGAYSFIFVSVLFWCTSDPMFEMIAWLRFPTEWGHAPDEIEQLDARRMAWPGKKGPVHCNLFRYRFDDEWETGITGPVTFSLGDQDFEGQSPEAIYAAYAEWYKTDCPSAELGSS